LNLLNIVTDESNPAEAMQIPGVRVIIT